MSRLLRMLDVHDFIALLIKVYGAPRLYKNRATEVCFVCLGCCVGLVCTVLFIFLVEAYRTSRVQ